MLKEDPLCDIQSTAGRETGNEMIVTLLLWFSHKDRQVGCY